MLISKREKFIKILKDKKRDNIIKSMQKRENKKTRGKIRMFILLLFTFQASC